MVGEIREPGYLEGGDFFPVGQDLAMVGVGLRSNFEACQQLMDEDLLGVRRLAVVRDEFEMHQVRRVGLCPACLVLPAGRETLHVSQPAKQALGSAFMLGLPPDQHAVALHGLLRHECAVARWSHASMHLLV